MSTRDRSDRVLSFLISIPNYRRQIILKRSNKMYRNRGTKSKKCTVRSREDVQRV